MKVEVEKQPDSISTLRIELGPEQVAQEWDAIANSFARHAKIAGYRAGKAPRRVVEAKFNPDKLSRAIERWTEDPNCIRRPFAPEPDRAPGDNPLSRPGERRSSSP